MIERHVMVFILPDRHRRSLTCLQRPKQRTRRNQLQRRQVKAPKQNCLQLKRRLQPKKERLRPLLDQLLINRRYGVPFYSSLLTPRLNE